MTETQTDVFDLIGVGFGPSNLALAIALQERGQMRRVRFLEARPRFAWHPDMMIAGSDMQVSFMKDLVSLRNPRSAFSFVSYLHDKGRLSRFINRKTFFPSREEFNDYLGWVAERLPVCDYDSRVVRITPVERAGRVVELLVTAENATGTLHSYRARGLVLAPGGQAYWPDCFRAMRGSQQIIHSQDYLSSIASGIRSDMRIAIIGGGQSAAEIFADLANRPEAPKVDMILRGRALMPSDDTPFVNEIFDPDQTARFHDSPVTERQRILNSLAATNYSVVDGDLIGQLYEMLYEQEVRGGNRLQISPETSVTGIRRQGGGVLLELDGARGDRMQEYDLVILATGYRRNLKDTVLKELLPWQVGQPDREYHLPMAEHFEPPVFVQGYSELTHGLSDTLLSVLPFRSDEIARALEIHHRRNTKFVAAE